MYTITAKSCEQPNITVEITAPWTQMREYIGILRLAFRDVTVVDNETGEVMLNHYESAEIFEQAVSYAEALHFVELAKEFFESGEYIGE